MQRLYVVDLVARAGARSQSAAQPESVVPQSCRPPGHFPAGVRVVRVTRLKRVASGAAARGGGTIGPPWSPPDLPEERVLVLGGGRSRAVGPYATRCTPPTSLPGRTRFRPEH